MNHCRVNKKEEARRERKGRKQGKDGEVELKGGKCGEKEEEGTALVGVTGDRLQHSFGGSIIASFVLQREEVERCGPSLSVDVWGLVRTLPLTSTNLENNTAPCVGNIFILPSSRFSKSVRSRRDEISAERVKDERRKEEKRRGEESRAAHEK